MASKAELDGVKSAQRAMAVLELFREVRRPCSAREIAEALAAPRSSTNVLLRSMIVDGYLRFDADRAVYFPSLRVAQLGRWLMEDYAADPAVEALTERLAQQTRETVCVWAPSNLDLQILSVRDSPHPIALTLRVGQNAPILRSAVGLAFLAALEDEDRARLIKRAEDRGVGPADGALLAAEIDETRRRGAAAAYHRWLPDAGAVAAPVLAEGLDEPLVVAVGGPVFRIRQREAEIIDVLRAAIAAIQGLRPGLVGAMDAPAQHSALEAEAEIASRSRRARTARA